METDTLTYFQVSMYNIEIRDYEFSRRFRSVQRAIDHAQEVNKNPTYAQVKILKVIEQKTTYMVEIGLNE